MHTMMQFTHEEKQRNFRFPCTEKELQMLTDSFALPNTADTKVKISKVYDNDKFNTLLSGREQNLDELNYLMKRIDSFDKWELDTFHAVAHSQKLTSLKDMINLSFNTHCYSLVDDFSDLNRLGRNLHLRTVGGIAAKEYEEFDGEAYVKALIETYPNPTVTPYGILYENDNQPELLYHGRTFPAYWYEANPITLEFSIEKDKEYLYLPAEESELTKVLQRLGAVKMDEAAVRIEEHNLPKNLADFVFADMDIEKLNQYAAQFHRMGQREIKALSELTTFAKISKPAELDTLIGCMYEFEYFPNIHSAEQYGRYMICESGHFELDENLEEYINFKAYGEDKVSRETGVFTDKGYLLYHGYSMEMQNILHKNIGLKRKEPQEQTELKLYMPIKAITYQDENDYGDIETVDFEIEICASDLAEYEAEIRMAMENRQRDDGERGMMEYYDHADTVNDKVQRYVFDVEEVQGELMGVAVLTLNAPLDAAEIEKIKAEISGQASDGFGEGFEQHEIHCDNKEIYVSVWGAEDWSLSTAEELGIIVPTKGMGGMSHV